MSVIKALLGRTCLAKQRVFLDAFPNFISIVIRASKVRNLAVDILIIIIIMYQYSLSDVKYFIYFQFLEI